MTRLRPNDHFVDMSKIPDLSDLPPLTITCPVCGSVSYNRNDIQQKYCGRCHQFHEFMYATPQTQEAEQTAQSRTETGPRGEASIPARHKNDDA